VWPHPRHFDHLNLRLDIDIPTMNEAKLTAKATLTAQAIGRTRDQLVLDCRGPQVGRVSVDGVDTAFNVENGKLRIVLPTPAELGRPITLVIHYSLDFSANKGEGLTWSPGKADAQSLTRRVPQIHAQGQAELNSRWFPCHDFPNERLTTEIAVTVEDGFDVVSNGRLVERASAGNARTRWHWVQDKPHNSYLVTLAVGKFAVVDIGGPDSARPGLPMPVYVNHGWEQHVTANFGNTPEMVAFFEKLFDEPYPWDMYAQVCVRAFAAGGMENTSCTLLTEGTGAPPRSDEPGPHDDLVAHELAHQWFGDLLTCKGWAHLWLNEGWASYSECLWSEHVAGKSGDAVAARRAYHRSVVSYLRGQRRNRGSAPESPALVSNRYTDPDRVFSKPDDPYGKGAVVLHLLRERLGDDAFFAGVRDYIDRYKFREVETDDFRRCLERASGHSLERFFQQYCYRPGLARLGVEFEWDEGTRTLGVRAEQTQLIDHLNPAYAFVIPILVKFDDGGTQWIDLPMDGRTATTSVVLKAKPTQASVDPNITCFAATEVRKPIAWWRNEAINGPTLAARLNAIDALRASTDPDAPAALVQAIEAAAGDSQMADALDTPVATNAAEPH